MNDHIKDKAQEMRDFKKIFDEVYQDSINQHPHYAGKLTKLEFIGYDVFCFNTEDSDELFFLSKIMVSVLRPMLGYDFQALETWKRKGKNSLNYAMMTSTIFLSNLIHPDCGNIDNGFIGNINVGNQEFEINSGEAQNFIKQLIDWSEK